MEKLREQGREGLSGGYGCHREWGGQSGATWKRGEWWEWQRLPQEVGGVS